MNKTSHLSTLLAVSAAFLLSAAPLTNAQAQASSTARPLYWRASLISP